MKDAVDEMTTNDRTAYKDKGCKERKKKDHTEDITRGCEDIKVHGHCP